MSDKLSWYHNSPLIHTLRNYLLEHNRAGGIGCYCTTNLQGTEEVHRRSKEDIKPDKRINQEGDYPAGGGADRILNWVKDLNRGKRAFLDRGRNVPAGLRKHMMPS